MGFVPQPNLREALADCAAVAQRAGQTLKESLEYPGTPLLDIALAQARGLIEACGYRRRLPELEDAERALR